MRLPLAFIVSLALFIFFPGSEARAAEPFFKKGDVIALVGGEDMVVASECGHLELLLICWLPDYQLRFRNLAWEGDTVFEQRRDLNFPTWEEQLDKIGATVVIAQFGQMESLAGKEKLPDFIAAYEKLIERFSGGGKRRIVLLSPIPFKSSGDATSNAQLELFHNAISELSGRNHVQWIDITASGRVNHENLEFIADFVKNQPIPKSHAVVGAKARDRALADLKATEVTHRDSVHLTEKKHEHLALIVSRALIPPDNSPRKRFGRAPLHHLIVAKNRLWFDYWRPQNWAFLAGDRTAQPSSRDHLDPSKRWFPPEREQFLPLIEAKEKEIDALVQKLSQP